MNEVSRLAKLPEFRALRSVLDALIPLQPEGRRKVVEAVHALLDISPGKKPSHGDKGPGACAAKTRKRGRR